MAKAAYIEFPTAPAFRAALREAEGLAPRQLSAAYRKAGVPIQAASEEFAPTGRSNQTGKAGAEWPAGSLKSHYKVKATLRGGGIVNEVPYSMGAEWGRFGKWSGFNKYPGSAESDGGRFTRRATEETKDEWVGIFHEEMEPVFEILGWASPVRSMMTQGA